MPKLQQLSPGGLHLVGLSWEEALQLVLRNLWRKHEWRGPDGLLVVQTGESEGVQSACGAARSVGKLDQCAQAVGEPTA